MSRIDYRRQFDLTGRVAAVTGGCGLLGREFCLALAQHGANIAIIDLDAARAEEFSGELTKNFGILAIAAPADISNPTAVRVAVDRLVSRLGGIDILVNNAQSTTTDYKQYFAPFEDYELTEWRRVLSVDLDGMAIVAQQVCRHMRLRNQGGSLIQIGSIYGAFGPDNRIYEGAEYKGTPINSPAVYSVGKAGVLGLTRWLATTYAQAGIRSNAIVPGGVESGQNVEFLRRYSDRVPLGRMARKEEIASSVVWLASSASSYVTGQCIFIDGGLSAW